MFVVMWHSSTGFGTTDPVSYEWALHMRELLLAMAGVHSAAIIYNAS